MKLTNEVVNEFKGKNILIAFGLHLINRNWFSKTIDQM